MRCEHWQLKRSMSNSGRLSAALCCQSWGLFACESPTILGVVTGPRKPGLVRCLSKASKVPLEGSIYLHMHTGSTAVSSQRTRATAWWRVSARGPSPTHTCAHLHPQLISAGALSNNQLPCQIAIVQYGVKGNRRCSIWACIKVLSCSRLGLALSAAWIRE
jgi:hypothetical protein